MSSSRQRAVAAIDTSVVVVVARTAAAAATCHDDVEFSDDNDLAIVNARVCRFSTSRVFYCKICFTVLSMTCVRAYLTTNRHSSNTFTANLPVETPTKSIVVSVMPPMMITAALVAGGVDIHCFTSFSIYIYYALYSKDVYS